MGWISDRHIRQGGSIGGKVKGRAYPKEGAPLRLVTSVIQQGTLFQPDKVRLECGHETTSWGGRKARCPACKHQKKGASPKTRPPGAVS